MRARTFSILTGMWVGAVLVAWVLWLVSQGLNPRRQFASLRTDVHVALGHGYISLFNDARYGPYTGSIVAVSGRGRSSVERRGFDGPGLYYRWFRFPGGRTLWTVSVSPLYLALPAALLLALSTTAPGAARLARRFARSLGGLPGRG